MVFDPKTWADGELITAADLNRVEQAVDAVDEQMGSKVDATDPRLSDARPPTKHTHEITDVDGLKATIDRLTVGTGQRDVRGLLAPGFEAKAITLSRVGPVVELAMDDLSAPTSDVFLSLGVGFRAMANRRWAIPDSVVGATNVATFQVFTSVRLYGSRNTVIRQTIQWITTDPWPSTLPGIPV